MIWSFLGKYRDWGLLLLRIGWGISYTIIHGYGKIFGGPERWEKIGGAMSNIGVSFMPTFWGFMAAFAEFGGGILLLLGLFFRPAVSLMLFTMFVAMMTHLGRGDGWGGASHALENGIVLLALLFIGPGKYSIDEKFGK